MTDYRPPISEIAFALEHLAGYNDVAALPGYEHADLDTVVGILEDAGAFMAEVVAPTNRIGDTEGSVRQPDGSVRTPDAFKSAYKKYVDAGWSAVPFPDEFGGGNFPWSIGLAIQETLLSSNMAFALCPLLTQGAIDALLAYGDDAQKKRYLPKMISGEWTGTMNLTEPQAGSDVGALTTRAVKRDDGTYGITGQKIFITYGEHDMSDEIIHLVLARTPDARPARAASPASSCPSSSSTRTTPSGSATPSTASRSSTSSASTGRRRVSWSTTTRPDTSSARRTSGCASCSS